MVRRRSQLIPWRVAGGVADEHANADQVVRETGWVFNNETGAQLTLEDFVMSGNKEVNAYLRLFGMNEMDLEKLSVLEIGSGIGRMTSRLTHRFGSVIAADVDATFLERCRETVAKHGVINRLRTAHVTDGHTVPLADNSVDAVFSYITLQHCSNADALALTKESIRVTKPHGVVMLNYRTWVFADIFLQPTGAIVRALWKTKVFGPWLAKQRVATRLGWQANRVSTNDVLDVIRHSGRPCSEIVLFHHPHRRRSLLAGISDRIIGGSGIQERVLPRANKSHWWLILRLGE